MWQHGQFDEHLFDFSPLKKKKKEAELVQSAQDAESLYLGCK